MVYPGLRGIRIARIPGLKDRRIRGTVERLYEEDSMSLSTRESTRSQLRPPADAWNLTAAEENRRYREVVFAGRLARAATTANIFLTRLQHAPAQRDEVLPLLKAVAAQVSEELEGYDPTTRHYRGAYLATSPTEGIEPGREVLNALRDAIALVEGRSDLSSLSAKMSDLAARLTRNSS